MHSVIGLERCRDGRWRLCGTARLALAALMVTLLGWGLAAGQAITASLRGRVVDAEGMPLIGVAVELSTRGGETVKKTAISDVEGRYRFRLLPPRGGYYLSVRYPGFATLEIGPIDLDPGRTTVQDITLRTESELAEHIEIQAQGAVVDTTSSKSATVFNREYIEGLPFVGRNYQAILTLAPGVTDVDRDGSPNVQGSRETGLQYRLDGGNVTDPMGGSFGQNLNLDAIEEIEIITAGASAEYGRADGGFANIITKSGGNDFEGTFRLFWQGTILNGDGAGENNDLFAQAATPELQLRRFTPFLTVGGAILKDRLWYFASYQHLDEIRPVSLAGAGFEERAKGHQTFLKLTFQASADHKLALQYNADPREIEGTFLDLGYDLDSDATLRTGGTSMQLRWTAIISPTLLMEALLTDLDAGVAVDPVSDRFRPIDVSIRPLNDTSPNLVAALPVEGCSPDGTIENFVPNCNPEFGEISIFQLDTLDGGVTGPYHSRTDDSRVRRAIRTDITWTPESAWGEHQLKTGIEFANEKFEDRPLNNPFLIDETGPCVLKMGCVLPMDPNLIPPPPWSGGQLLLYTPIPNRPPLRATSFNAAAYLSDTWRPTPNLTIQAGMRIDSEDIDSSGYEDFEPLGERRREIAVVDALCAEAKRVSDDGGLSTWTSNCDPSTGFVRGGGPKNEELMFVFDNRTPYRIRRFDRNRDGVFDSDMDGRVWREAFTEFVGRAAEDFTISNLNLSPRFSVAWDPLADGRTKLFGSWGRYYDRLFLNTVTGEMEPAIAIFTFNNQMGKFYPLASSEPTRDFSLQQVDRNLRTPFTDVFTVGVERELATEWSAKVTYTQRLGWDLLQDTDVNHILCSEFGDALGVDPGPICYGNEDLFGGPGYSLRGPPNGAPDLYFVNPYFNQVLRVGNFNSSRFTSMDLEIMRRLHRNWQLRLNYTYSRAEGQAEEFSSMLGNDPSTKDDEEGLLDFDQTHRAVLTVISQLPGDLELGGTLSWESGTPFSVVGRVSDRDSAGNLNLRTFFPTGERNDQRNGPFWRMDLRLVKRFLIGKMSASAELTVENLLNMDDLTLAQFRPQELDAAQDQTAGVQLAEGPNGLRRFGRIWELGFSLAF